MTSAIIVAAGSSQRMGFDKLLAYIGPRQVIAHTLAAFDDCPDIDEIILITNEERFKAIERIEQEECFQKLTHIIHGGAERHHSVWNGLQDLNPANQYVAVHDGARPLITTAQISRCIAAAKEHRAAASAHPITDTVMRADHSQQTSAHVDRDNLWAMETPQVFETALLIEAYEKVLAEGKLVTDEVSAIEGLGHKVQLVPNETPNPKITFKEDLDTAAKLLDIQ
jgi:2-C-methyl-D-erythritol 4-phosphate cytidylyltransferase